MTWTYREQSDEGFGKKSYKGPLSLHPHLRPHRTAPLFLMDRPLVVQGWKEQTGEVNRPHVSLINNIKYP